MNAQVNADASLQAHLQNAPVVEARASGMRSEWRIASWTVRFSAICLVAFYLLAAASPFFASYDPTYQNRTMPDCPPMALHLSAPSEWSRGLFYTHPMQMTDASLRKFSQDNSRRLYIHLFTRAHIFTTDSHTHPYFILATAAPAP